MPALPALPAGFAWTLAGIAGLIALDTLLGWALAVKTGTWDWSKAGQFIVNVARYLGGGLCAAITANLHPQWSSLADPAFYAAAGAVGLQFVLGDIRTKALALFAPLAPSAPTTAAKGA